MDDLFIKLSYVSYSETAAEVSFDCQDSQSGFHASFTEVVPFSHPSGRNHDQTIRQAYEQLADRLI